MQAAASIESSAFSFGTRMALPSGALPVCAEIKPPAAMMRSKARAVHRQVADHRKRARAPRLQVKLVAVLEMAHVKLADRGAALGTVGHAVDHETAHAADALAAIVIERDRLLALRDQAFVDHIQHLQKRHVRADVRAPGSEPSGRERSRSSAARRAE